MERLIFLLSGGTAAVLVYGLYLVVTADRRHLLGRLERHVVAPWRAEVKEDEIRSLRRRPGGRVLGSQRGRPAGPLSKRMVRFLGHAGVALRPAEFVAMSLLAGAAGALLFWVIFRRPLGLVVGLAAALVPYLLVARTARRRQMELERRLPDFLMSLVGALRAGHGLLQALQSVSEEIVSPLSAPVQRALAETQMGTPLEDALERVAEQVGNPDVDMIVTAILIQRRVGGNLGEILETVSETTRERVRLRLNLRTLTAQGRMSAVIICLLPVAVGTLSALFSPDLAHILFGELIGHLLLGLAVVLELLGVLVVRRVVDIRF